IATLSLTTMTLVPALAQDGTGLRGVLSFSQGIEYSDNPSLATVSPGGEFLSVTGLSFSLSSETRAEKFSFNVGTSLEGNFDSSSVATDDFEFKDTDAAVAYEREGSNSNLTFRARYRETDIQDDFFGFFVDGVFDPDALIIDGGIRESFWAFGRFETGVEGPLGFVLSARHRITNYVGTTDPDLVDNDNTSIDATGRFRINPALSARAVAGYRRNDEEDLLSTSNRTKYIGVGVETETAGGLTYTGDITAEQTETYELGALTSDDEGIGIDLSATQERTDGSYGVDIGSHIDESGRRTTARVRRFYDLQNGSLFLSLGVADQEGEDLEFTTRVSYLRDLQDKVIRADVIQSPSTSDGEAFLNTAIRLNYMQEINSISSWDAGFTYGSANMFGEPDGDTRTAATFAYNRDLTEEWNLRAGIELIRIEDDGGADRDSNTVFVSIGRDFSLGF
ncbi:MAG: hypothetical protein ACR2O1_11490, partial [Boseongicola sp.]